MDKCYLRSWVRRFGDDRDGWAWHPYTVAERLVNLIGFAQSSWFAGEQSETLTFLSHHGAAILSHLEYFGENNTGNHLANNGRGLFLGGLELGLDQWADVGGRILIEEGRRIFTSNGLLRGGIQPLPLIGNPMVCRVLAYGPQI